jgi:KDO2-lipid IV(A) lauroyltransferase
MILDWVVFVIIRCIVQVLRLTPGWLAYRVAEWAGLVVFHLDKKHKRIGLINLSIAFPQKSEEWKLKTLKESFKQIGIHAVELSRLKGISEEEIQKRVRYEEGYGLDHYLRAKNQGRGVIFLTAHVCAWELLPLAHAVLGHPLSFIVRPLDNPYLDRWIKQTRNQFGNQSISKFGSVRRLLKILHEQKDIGILIDQNVQEKDGIFVPFFGKPACTTSSAAALALKTGAPVVAGFLLPAAEKGKYLIRFYPPLNVISSGDKEKDLIQNTRRYLEYLEDVLRSYPQGWLWGHRRYRTQPDGSDPYQ